MRTGVLAKKIGMTRVFAADGAHVPVTVLSLEGCQVIGIKKNEIREVAVTKKGEQVGTRQANDGYTAVVLAAGARKAKNISKAIRGVFAKASVEPKARITSTCASVPITPTPIRRGMSAIATGAK